MAISDLDWISIEGLIIDTVIGVYDWEQQQTQQLRIDIDMGWDIQAAAKTDDIAQAVDYARVSEAIVAWVTQQPRQLIETVAEGVAQLVLEQFSVSDIKVKVSKPDAVPAADNVAVTIRRSRFDSAFG
ncbi:MAG: dihydroneopterin aldolase [Idiomarina sp.]|uniref:dihydroneopterin aldolase n=1 Tax=Idiomarina sp. TaxID=1874361 RepID=UPI000C6C1C48|nr:dihydroneopterin aldolase [Idiomarina sp.]MBT41798.1 dihydroneopterin aldolase [Idiomarina sp.]